MQNDYIEIIKGWLRQGLVTPQELDEVARIQYAIEAALDNAQQGE